MALLGIIGVLIWAGLYFRDHRIRDLIPVRTNEIDQSNSNKQTCDAAV